MTTALSLVLASRSSELYVARMCFECPFARGCLFVLLCVANCTGKFGIAMSSLSDTVVDYWLMRIAVYFLCGVWVAAGARAAQWQPGRRSFFF